MELPLVGDERWVQVSPSQYRKIDWDEIYQVRLDPQTCWLIGPATLGDDAVIRLAREGVPEEHIEAIQADIAANTDDWIELTAYELREQHGNISVLNTFPWFVRISDIKGFDWLDPYPASARPPVPRGLQVHLAQGRALPTRGGPLEVRAVDASAERLLALVAESWP